jgi:hypothetical protein
MNHAASVNCNIPSNGANLHAHSVLQGASASGNTSEQVFAFVDLLDAYQPYGGLSRTNGLPAGGRVRCFGRDRLVDDLVAQGELIAFTWHDTVWMPMFQFDMLGIAVEPKPQVVIATLGLGCNGWALANWFVQPNRWLESHRPIQCLASRLSDVLYAAREYRAKAIGCSSPTPSLVCSP